MHAHASRTTVRRIGAAAVLAGVVSLMAMGTGGAAHADASLLVTTPYPSIEAQPGSNVKLSLTVTSTTPETVDLAVKDLPDGWGATLRGGGFVIHSITS